MTDLTTLAYVLKTGVAGPEAQAAAAAEITRLRDQVETLSEALTKIAYDTGTGLQSNIIAYECCARAALETTK
ncbi:MAG: hypothetical protein MJH10_15530 [Epibacterium sp.]|nr:hypothetical protein [Epibacterium sp.]NQX74930.1 hypothetical protein [Epibacterium sp.]